ncbi:alpha/beta fold hydrolase [Gorillibacterium sp. sgz500922]|uniref:alpha/beta fold hydrolase n=1 Tax=Gorillibacterium sp. sgz500922 TaxID=3446694 RepID=UPI003F664F80
MEAEQGLAMEAEPRISAEAVQPKKKSRRWLKIGLLIMGGLLVLMSLAGILLYFDITPTKAAVASAGIPNGEGELLEVNGFNLWYKQTGNPQGAPIIAIHGGPGLSSYYFHNYLDFLNEKNQVIYYDQRGCGNSESKSELQNYGFAQLTDDLDVIVNHFGKTQPVTLLGHSFGAIVALQYALDHPDKVDKLILVSTPFIKSTMQPGMLLQLYRTLPPMGSPKAVNQWYSKRMAEYYKSTLYKPADDEKLDIGPASYAPMMSVFKTMKSFSLKDRLPGFDKTTLIIYGAAEKEVISTKDQLTLHQDLPNSTLVKFDHSGHWSFLEEPENFQKTVLDFLAK